jgi:hypothetical protein
MSKIGERKRKPHPREPERGFQDRDSILPKRIDHGPSRAVHANAWDALEGRLEPACEPLMRWLSRGRCRGRIGIA